MRFRLLLTDGSRTVDLIWADHNGSDFYYGIVGASAKSSYHASGARHTKWKTGERIGADRHHRMDAFAGQLQLCAFGVHTNLEIYPQAAEYTGKKGDSAAYLDTRTLPEFLSISLGLVECSNLAEMLPVAPGHDVRLIHVVPSTVPWIYVTVHAISQNA